MYLVQTYQLTLHINEILNDAELVRWFTDFNFLLKMNQVENFTYHVVKRHSRLTVEMLHILILLIVM